MKFIDRTMRNNKTEISTKLSVCCIIIEERIKWIKKYVFQNKTHCIKWFYAENFQLKRDTNNK